MWLFLASSATTTSYSNHIFTGLVTLGILTYIREAIFTVKTMDAYKVLGVSPGADRSAIRKAYHKLCLTHHPDKAGDSPEVHERFVRIQEAYNKLTEDKAAGTSENEKRAGHRARPDRETKPPRTHRPRRESPSPERRRPHHRRPASRPKPSFAEMCDFKWAAEDMAMGIAEDLETRKKSFVSLRRRYERFAHGPSVASVQVDFDVIEGELEDNIKEADRLARRIEVIDVVEWWNGTCCAADISEALDELRSHAGDCRRKLDVLENTIRSAELAAVKAKEWDKTFREQVSRW